MPDSNIASEVAKFETISIDEIDNMKTEDMDGLPFGVIGFSPSGCVDVYNAFESEMTGFRPKDVIGKSMFVDVSPCMNTDRVTKPFENEITVDAIIDYVLTPRMRPTSIRLRLLKSNQTSRRYVLVQNAREVRVS